MGIMPPRGVQVNINEYAKHDHILWSKWYVISYEQSQFTIH